MKTYRMAILASFALFMSADISRAATTQTISQWGVTWTFDKPYEYGQFANGDYWVKTDSVTGYVTIKAISPAVDIDLDQGNKLINGWEVNPKVGYKHGFDGRSANFNAALVPSLPYSASSGESIVKAISHLPFQRYPMIKTAVVLTILDIIPPDNGATLFRPPYVGIEKPLISVSQIQWYRVPSYAPAGTPPTLQWVVDQFKYLRMDHIKGNSMETRPSTNIVHNGYSADMNFEEGEAILRLMLNDSSSSKKEALISVLQAGIDYCYFIKNGQNWPAGGGEQPGRILLPLFASYILGDSAMQAAIANSHLYEELTLHRSPQGTVLWGHYPGYNDTEVYWEQLDGRSASGQRTLADPHRFIDGGAIKDSPYIPGGGYQYCCTSQGFKQTALIMRLIPELQFIWDFPELLEYAERWVTHGTSSQPDPCAPATTVGVYGVNYGPKPTENDPYGCILDPRLQYYNSRSDFAYPPGVSGGRFPERDGTSADGGDRYSAFTAEMWKKYWASSSTKTLKSPSLNSPQGLIIINNN